jgi:hypothetical protein
MLVESAEAKIEREARRWLAKNLGFDPEPLFPFTEAARKGLGQTSMRTPYWANGIAAGLVVVLLLFPSLYQDTGLFRPVNVLVITGLANFIVLWSNNRKLSRAMRMDHAFYETVQCGETDLSLWPIWSPDNPTHMELALSCAKRAKERLNRDAVGVTR